MSRILLVCLLALAGVAQTSSDTFMKKLVAAADDRPNHVVRYDPGYVKIVYPNGDVPAETGVCSDEIIRIYRAVGVDLQQLVHEDMVANRSAYPFRLKWMQVKLDTNIDHRRVPNLAVFFSRKGQTIEITDKPADYVPGDIVMDAAQWARPYRDGDRPQIGRWKIHGGTQYRRRTEDRGCADGMENHGALSV